MILSIIVLTLLCMSVVIRRRSWSLAVQALSCLVESAYDFTIAATTGAVLALLNFVRSILFINKRKFSRCSYLVILIIFEMVVLANCLLTWAGLVSLLPTVGSIIRTYCLWQGSMMLVRLSGVTTGLFYGAYYVCYGSWFMVVGYAILLVIGLYEIRKNDVKKLRRLLRRSGPRRVVRLFLPSRS